MNERKAIRSLEIVGYWTLNKAVGTFARGATWRKKYQVI